MRWPDLRHIEGNLSPHLEAAYRRYYLKDDVHTAGITMVVLCVLLVAFAYNDYTLFGPSGMFFYLLTLRASYFIYFICLSIYLRKNPDPAKFDLQLFIWLLLSAVLVQLINITRPASYSGFIIIDVILILLVYLCMPMRFLFRFIGAIIFTSAEIFMFFILRPWSSPVTEYVSLVSMVFANIGGIFASATLYSYRRKEFQARLEEQNLAKQWQTTFDAISDLVSIQDKDCKLVRVNRSYAEAFHTKPDELVGQRCYKIVHNKNAPIDGCPHMQTLQSGQSTTMEVFEPHLGRFLEVTTSPINSSTGELTGTIHLVKDITRRKKVEQEIKQNRDLLNDMGKSAKIGAWEFLPETMVQTWTEEVYHIHELEPGSQPTVEEGINFYAPEAQPAISQAVRSAMESGTPFDLELPFITARGNHRWVHTVGTADRENDRTVRVWGIFQDITERRQMMQQLEDMATHDYLTGLPNRMLLADRFAIALSQAARSKRRLALLSLDLDHFKLINDSLGHSAGDDVLKQFSGRLSRIVRASDTVARIGGDEFLLLLQDVHHPPDVIRVSQDIINSFREPFAINGNSLNSSTSIDIALYPDDGKELDTLIKNSDEALYLAKGKGRNNFQFFSANQYSQP